MNDLMQQLEQANAEYAQLRAVYDANKGKDDRKSKKLARDAAERLEWAGNRTAMLKAMMSSPQFAGQ